MAPALSLPCLCLVTDRTICGSASLESVVASAVRGGVSMVQIREKDLSGGALLELVSCLKKAVGSETLLMVNERADVALACGVHGVQLGEEGLPVSVARTLVGRDLLIGRSVHSLDAAVQGEEEGADFLIVGTIFPTASHPEAQPAGVGLLTQIARRVRIPFLGIGGINSGNIGDVMDAGASGAAVIRSVLAANRPGEAAAELWQRMHSAWRSLETGGRRA